MEIGKIKALIKVIKILLDALDTDEQEQELKTLWFKGFEYKEVMTATGRIWLDRNLGARRVAQAMDDESSYGGYYSFDEVECPPGYRLPTEEEWKEEMRSWDDEDTSGAFNSSLKLPMAGLRESCSGSLFFVGSYGFYWSSTVFGSNARRLYFYSCGASMYSSNRAGGGSVRCIKEMGA